MFSIVFFVIKLTQIAFFLKVIIIFTTDYLKKEIGVSRVMVKKVLWICCLGLFLFSCGKKTTYRIEGELSNLEDKTLYAVFEGKNSKVVDTLLCKDKKILFEENDSSLNIATIFLNQKTRWITVYLEPGVDVEISGDAMFPDLIDIKGGKLNNELSVFRSGIKQLLKEKEDLTRNLTKSDKSNIDASDVTSKLINIKHSISEEAVKYIQNHPQELASAILIQTYFSDPDDTRKMDELLALLDPKVKELPLVKELEQFSAKVKQTAIGADAPGFTVKNIHDKDLSLSTFDKQYLLLTFVAPWCDICRVENFYLKGIRKMYPKDKLEILSVTLDTDQDSIRKTAKLDTISWHLVSDSAGYASMMIDLYGVNAIPKNFLIDETGKIILKTENNIEIEQLLEKLIEKQLQKQKNKKTDISQK